MDCNPLFSNRGYKSCKNLAKNGVNRSNAGAYYVESEEFRLCPMIAHELGHNLGLPDEYSEAKTCRIDASEYNYYPYNIMANTTDLEVTDTYPRNLREIFGTLEETELQIQANSSAGQNTVWPEKNTVHGLALIASSTSDSSLGSSSAPTDSSPVNCRLTTFSGALFRMASLSEAVCHRKTALLFKGLLERPSPYGVVDYF